MSYSSLTSSKINNSSPQYNESTIHPPKSSFHKELNISANIEPPKKTSSCEGNSKISFSMIFKDKSPEEYPAILKEIIFQAETVFRELQRVEYMSEELMSENRIWKEEYKKLKLTVDPNSNENYERNFIRRLADLKTLILKKDEEISKISVFLKKMENENNYLKNELDIKNSNLGNSPTLKNELKNKISELESRNATLIKEINSVRMERNIHPEDRLSFSPKGDKFG